MALIFLENGIGKKDYPAKTKIEEEDAAFSAVYLKIKKHLFPAGG